jgi:TonB family protein
LAAAASTSTELPTGGKGGPSETETAGAGDNQNQGPGAGVVINGPIRDAGELRALAGNPNPIYPARDRLRRNEGTAVVLGQVAADGRVSRVVLEKSSGSKDMDLESAKAFKNWRFQSGQAGWVRKPFQFRLVGQAKEVPAPLGEVLQRKSGALGK